MKLLGVLRSEGKGSVNQAVTAATVKGNVCYVLLLPDDLPFHFTSYPPGEMLGRLVLTANIIVLLPRLNGDAVERVFADRIEAFRKFIHYIMKLDNRNCPYREAMKVICGRLKPTDSFIYITFLMP